MAQPPIVNPLLTVAPFAGASIDTVAPVTVSVTSMGTVIVRSGLVDVTSRVAVWTPGCSPALEATTRNVFGWVRSAVPADGVAETQRSSAGALAGAAAVHPV